MSFADVAGVLGSGGDSGKTPKGSIGGNVG